MTVITLAIKDWSASVPLAASLASMYRQAGRLRSSHFHVAALRPRAWRDLAVHLYPHLPAPLQHVHTFEARVQEYLRGPNARFIMWAGTVGHNIAIARQVLQRRHRDAVCQPPQFDVDRVLDPVALQIGFGVAHVDYGDR